MSGDASSADIEIPSVFMQRRDAERMRHLLDSGDEVFVLLTWIRREEEAEEGEGEGEGQHRSSGDQSSLYDNGEQTEDRMELEQDQNRPPSYSSSENNDSSH